MLLLKTNKIFIKIVKWIWEPKILQFLISKKKKNSFFCNVSFCECHSLLEVPILLSVRQKWLWDVYIWTDMPLACFPLGLFMCFTMLQRYSAVGSLWLWRQVAAGLEGFLRISQGWFCISGKHFSVCPWLSWNLLCRLASNLRSAILCLLSAEIFSESTEQVPG